MFPDLCRLNTILVYAGDEKQNIPDQDLIETLAASHFGNVTINKISEEDKEKFNEWLTEAQIHVFVSGSFSRSGISELFSRSFN